MNRSFSSAITALLTWLLSWPLVASAADGERDLAAQVHALLAAKCAGCHGPDLPKPKGRFGYVLDLARLAASPEIVVPFSPDESEMWELVRRGEMPPPDAPTGSLTDQQKELIRAWIAAGAPADDASVLKDDSAPLKSEADSSMPAVHNRWLRSLGALHVIAVHFPIALLIAAAGIEFWCMLLGNRSPTSAVRLCILLGAASAVVTASLGWIHASNGYGLGMSHTLWLHRWIGTAAAAWAVGTALLSERDERNGERSGWFRTWLLLGALLVAIEGHLGGILVHGDDFFSGG
jgi:mono/diheme cytochrome c family protein/uncharacterized membrane protein